MRNNLNINFIYSKKGISSLSLLISSVVLSTFIMSCTSWFLSLHKDISEDSERLTMMSIAQDVWNRTINEDYLALSTAIGSMSKEGDYFKDNRLFDDISASYDNRYEISRSYSEEGTFLNGNCNIGNIPSDIDVSCRKVVISVKDKTNILSRPYSLNPTLVASRTYSTPKPDWSKADVVRKSSYTPIDYTYTVPADGMIIFSIGGNIGGFRSRRQVYINGKDVYDASDDGHLSSLLSSGHGKGDLDNIDSSFLMVSQKDSVRFFVGNTNNTQWNSLSIKYVPYKGAKFVAVDNHSDTANDTVDVSNINVADGILPKGTILSYYGNVKDIPKGWHLCDGTDGTPNLIGRFLQGGNLAGNYIEAGLPNITGTATTFEWTSGSLFVFEGALYHWKQWYNGHANMGSGGSGSPYLLNLDASRSNPIYGNSNTVQPPAVTVLYIMKM